MRVFVYKITRNRFNTHRRTPNGGKTTSQTKKPTGGGSGLDDEGKKKKPKPKNPKDPRGEDDSDDKKAAALATKIARIKRALGRMRPQFKRENNTTIPEEEQEPGNDDLFGDDNEEVEFILQEQNTILNKFGMFEIDPEDPGTQAEMMDDGLKFYGDPEMYSSNCGVAGYTFNPDFGYVKASFNGGTLPLA